MPGRIVHWAVGIAAALWVFGIVVDLLANGAITEACCLP